ncbi:putative transporter [Vanrija pseudolonga]|uniref:Purtative transporter n=1 Tax=Vanrija pseudolonga TaxID=143232 RepID=A0AAF0YHK7_9TREE|nr:purtative transporter [Vanrija pseudolonga]
MSAKDYSVAEANPPRYHTDDVDSKEHAVITQPVDASLNDKEAKALGDRVLRDSNGQVIEFDAAMERKLVRKIDLFVVPTVALLYLFCFIDVSDTSPYCCSPQRANIGNARLAGMEKSLNLHGYQYNLLLTVFYVSYIVFEIPSNILCKYLGPARWLPFISFGFGLMSLCTAFVTNFSNAAAVRFLLGVFEAGLLPGIAYYLSRWYRKSELSFRLALYLFTAPCAGAFGGLLASGILKIKSIGRVHSWQNIFLIEGIITCGISLIAFFTMPGHPATARFLSPFERELAMARVKAENVGSTKVVDKFDRKKLLRGIINPNTLAVSWMFLFVNITVQGIAFFTPTIIATIYPHASTIRKQLYTVPPYVVGAVVNLIVPFISVKTNKRLPLFIGSSCLCIIGYIIFLATANPHARYGAVFLAVSGAFPFGPLCNGQVAINILSDTGRSTGIGWNVMVGNIGGLISTWSYLPTDSPNYHIGNGLNLAGNSTILITSICLLLWLQWDNKRRDRADNTGQLEGLTEEEIEDLDWKHPSWRWYL